MTYRGPLTAALETRRIEIERTNENAARNARLHLLFVTHGAGMMMTAATDFGMWFVQKPQVITGASIVEPGSADDLGGTAMVSGDLPLVTAGVYSWAKTTRGIYTGASMWFRIDTQGTSYDLEHCVTFEGIAVKMLPPGL